MQRVEGFYVYYWYVVVWAVKESPNFYGDSYNSQDYVGGRHLQYLSKNQDVPEALACTAVTSILLIVGCFLGCSYWFAQNSTAN